MGADDFYGDENYVLTAQNNNPFEMPASAEVMSKVRSDSMIHLLEHPVIQHKITRLRNKDTGKAEVRSLVKEIAVLGFYEMTWHLPWQLVFVETPVAQTYGPELSGKKPVLVPVWRAGEPMADAIVSSVMPSAKVGNIGMYRNQDDITHPTCYYDKMPSEMDKREAFVLDPMLATGYSAARVISILKDNYGCKKIHFMCIISVWDGINVLRKQHPDVDLYLGVVDACLNEKHYIVPGLGDAGDRITGTK